MMNCIIELERVKSYLELRLITTEKEKESRGSHAPNHEGAIFAYKDAIEFIDHKVQSLERKAELFND